MLNAAMASLFAYVGCHPLPGAEALLARPEIRWIVVGEMHGTNETPQATLDLICAAVASGKIVRVAIEHRADSQATLDTFLASKGRRAARSRLLKSPAWDRAWADGKSSLAMLSFIDAVRKLHHRGKVEGIVAFDPYISMGSDNRNREMAVVLRSARRDNGEIMIVLTGRFHARKIPEVSDSKTYLTMVPFLPKANTVSLDAVGSGSGTGWFCAREGCGTNAIPGKHTGPRRVVMRASEDGAYDGVIDLGIPTSASPPANR
jgi:hypothetical protein